MLILKTLFLLVGFLALVLTIRAFFKGPNYISTVNFGWSERTLNTVFQCKSLNYFIFRTTPFSIVIISNLATCSILYSLLYPLDGIGRLDVDGDWVSYRWIISSSIGIFLGFGLTSWVFSVCSQVPLPREINKEMDPVRQLCLLLGKDLGD